MDITIDKPIISDYKKSVNDFKEIKRRSEDYANYLMTRMDPEEIESIKINLDLINGKLDVEKFYDNPVEVQIGTDTVQLDFQDITHTPLIAQVANTYIGEVIKLGVVYNIKDENPGSSTIAQNQIKDNISEVANQFLESNKRKALLKVMEKYGVADPFQTPEVQQQMNQEVEQLVSATTSKDIQNFLKTRVSTPRVRGAQQILRALTLDQKIRDEQIQALKYMMASGKIIFHSTVENEEVVYEAVNPMFCNWDSSLEYEDIQKSRIFSRVMWMTKDDILQKYAEDLTKSDIEKLESQYEYSGYLTPYKFQREDSWETKHTMMKMSQEPYVDRLRNININTREGQAQFNSLRSEIFPEYGHKEKSGIRVTHVVFREKRVLKKVTRLVEDEKQVFWVAAGIYQKHPADIEVKRVVIDEVWEDTIIGTFDTIHVRTRPYPRQFIDPKNPFKVNFPYVGRVIGTNKGVTDPFVFIDLGKAAQKDFDITISAIKHSLMTDMGSVFMFIMNMKPDNISWQDFIDSIRNLRLMPIDSTKVDQVSVSLTKEISLSSSQDIAVKLKIADLHQQMLYTSMLFNAERVGSVSPYHTSSNKDSSLSGSYNQTTLMTQEFLNVINESYNLLLNVGFFYYKERPEHAGNVLDDISLIDLMQASPMGYYYKNIKVVNSYDELDLLKQIKSYALAFIQNSDNYLSIIDIILSRTEDEIRDILEQETVNRRTLLQETRQHELQLRQTELQNTELRENAKRQTQMEVESLRQEKNLERARIQVQTFALANDVNRDGQSDALTSNILRLENELKIAEMDGEIEREKLKNKIEIEKMRKNKI